MLPTINTPDRQAEAFPVLTPAQIARISAHGRRRPILPGEVLIEAGSENMPFFVVVEGKIDILQSSGATETLVAVHGPGQFTGETQMFSHRRTLAQARAREAGEVIELDRESLMALVQTNVHTPTQLSQVLTLACAVDRSADLLVDGFRKPL